MGPVLTVPLEPSYTWLKRPNKGEVGPRLLVFRDNLVWQFGLDLHLLEQDQD